MARPRYDLLDRLFYLAVRFAAMMLHCWPITWWLAGANLVGDVWFHTVRRHRDRALENLRHAYPELSEARRREIARLSMRWVCHLGLDFLFTTRLVHVNTWARVATLHDFEKSLRLLLDKHRGLIMLTGHYGNWEVLGYLLATLGFKMSAIGRPLDNPHLYDWVLGTREKKGLRVLAKTGAMAEVPEILDRHGVVGIIADQNAGSKGLFVDFFNRKAATYKSVALLAIRHEVPVVVGYARRRQGQFHFDVGTTDVIYPADWADQDDPVRYITQRYVSAMETFIRQDPTQYLWIHRRWKTRPKDELAPAGA